MNLRRIFLWAALFALGFAEITSTAGEVLKMNSRRRAETEKGTGQWQVIEKQVELDPAKTAIVICDMWDKHWCKGATERVAEMAPRMNEVVKAARSKGVFIIHAPSDTMKFYEGTPQRKRAQSAPVVTPPVPLKGWCHLDPSKEAPLPIDDSDGGCDDLPQCAGGGPWKRQIPTIEIAEQDAITDSAEAYNLLQERGIENVIIMGVHANMCVLGRPFSIRQMVSVGKNVLLMRDMTDTMYNSRRKPYVNHFRGTDLIIEHIEKYWCPSITSADILGGEPFRFSKDKRPVAAFVIGEDEYKTKETLPAFAAKELVWRGFDPVYIHSSEADPNDFPGMEALKKADLMVLSVRRRALSEENLKLIRDFVESGKPVLAIRTASHAFEPAKTVPGRGSWPNFDVEVLGGDYQGHYGKGPATIAEVPPQAVGHAIVTGLSKDQLKFESHLYKYPKMAPGVTVLLRGWVEGKENVVEPVAWVNTAQKRKVFYTSLGGPEDFENPAFRRLLLNSFLWAADLPIPPKEVDFSKQWQVMNVPGTWEDNSNGVLNYDGTAWYRCYVKLPDEWNRTDIELFVEKIDNAHEAYFNGLKVGGAGSFPPAYANGLDISARYRIPSASIRAGAYNLVAIRVYDNDGRGGFKGKAPQLVRGREAINLKGAWQFRTGDNPEWATEIKKPDSAPEFSKVEPAENLTTIPPKEQDGPFSPEDSLRRFKVFDDLEIEQVLAEPIVRQPLHLSWDARGRLWIVQYIQYPAPAGLTLLSKDQFWRAVYDKVPPAPPNHFRGEDKITIHEDSDGDGTLDKHKTFIDGLNIVTAVEHGRGGVWILNPPYLLFYPDKNRDDVPDADPVVHLAGFGLEDTHSVANSLRWGPDGWLYGAHGSTVTANIIRPGLDKEPIVHALGQHVWRYHPESRRFEIFAEGGGNAFGLELDDQARIFSGHNGGNTRGFHYVQGGYLQKGFEKHGPLSNPFVFGYFRQMANNNVERFTHTFVIYGGGALPETYHGKLFGVEPLQGRVVYSDVLRDRSSFKTWDLGHAVLTSDKYFKPVDIKTGPDGAIYIADWYDRQVSHTRNYEGNIDKNNGRVYRLKRKDATPIKTFDLAAKSNGDLVELLGHKNRWIRQAALRLIADRKDSCLVPRLKKLCLESSGQLALEALWALELTAGLDDPTALALLDHPEGQVRAWTVRLLGDRREISHPAAQKFTSIAESDPEVEVRSQLASTARRLPADQALPIVRALLARSEDVADIHMPLLLWWAIEAKAESNREAVLALFADSRLWQLPIVQNEILERIMKRYAMAGIRADLLACARLLDMAPEAIHKQKLMAGFEEAFKGRSMSGLPEELREAIARSGGESLPLALRRGDPAAIEKALGIIKDENAPAQKRIEYIQIFGEVKHPAAAASLMEIVRTESSAPIRKAALTALQIYDGPEIPNTTIEAFPNFSTEVQTTALSLLASRENWSLALIAAIREGKIPSKTAPQDVVDKLRTHPATSTFAEELFGKKKTANSAEVTERINRFARQIQSRGGDPFEGQKYFTLACAGCHKLFGEGGQIGPDLTTYKRDDLETMLLHIINPSAEIREGYENFFIETKDGRTLSGFLADKDNQVIIIRGIDGENVVIPKKDVQEMKAAGASLMPEGLLDAFEEQQVRDLFAYLRSTQPLVKR